LIVVPDFFNTIDNVSGFFSEIFNNPCEQTQFKHISYKSPQKYQLF